MAATSIYRADFDFEKVNLHLLDVDVPSLSSYGVYVLQLVRFAGVCNHALDFIARSKSLAAKLLQLSYRYTSKDFYPNFISDTMNWFLNQMSD